MKRQVETGLLQEHVILPVLQVPDSGHSSDMHKMGDLSMSAAASLWVALFVTGLGVWRLRLEVWPLQPSIPRTIPLLRALH